MRFRLTREQESCLQDASDQPVGRKGQKWLAWANGELEAAGLGEVEVLEPPASDAAPAPKVSGLQKPKVKHQQAFQAPPQGLQATLQLLEGGQQQQHGGGSIQIPRTFVVQSGVLTGPGVSITIEQGTLTGYFLVSCHVAHATRMLCDLAAAG